MYLNQFPDLQWLKKQIDRGFEEQRSWQGKPLPKKGFPNVVIESGVQHHERPEVKGPLSVFLNLQGSSVCKVNGREIVVPPGYFLVSNHQQEYSLYYEEKAHTFNIHFGEAFYQEFLSKRLFPNDPLEETSTLGFAMHNRLYPISAALWRWVQQLRKMGKSISSEHLETALIELTSQLVGYQKESKQQQHRLSTVKKSTQTALFRQLAASIDLMYASFQEPFSLEKLAATSGLSKFHYLRLFKLAFGVSPLQFNQQLRLQKACELLKHTAWPINEISFELGFEAPNSFSRFFQQQMGCSPAFFRAQAK